MSSALNISIQEAEQEVTKSSQELEIAVDHLKVKVEDSANTIERYALAVRNPYVLVAVVATLGVFMGKLIRNAFENKSRSNYVKTELII